MANIKRKKQIIDASIKIISEEGIYGFTIKNLAEKVGVSEPALYRHFKNKSDIVMGILDTFEEESNFVLSDIEKASLSSIDKISKFFIDRCTLFANKPELAKVMFSECMFQEKPEFSQKMLSIMHKHASEMRKIIIEGQSNNEIKDCVLPIDLFRIIFGSMRLIINQWVMSNYSFDLIIEGQRLWNSIKVLIIK